MRTTLSVVLPEAPPLEWRFAERNDCQRLLTRRRELAASETEVLTANRRRSRAVVRAYALRREVRETEDALRALAKKVGKAGHASSE